MNRMTQEKIFIIKNKQLKKITQEIFEAKNKNNQDQLKTICNGITYIKFGIHWWKIFQFILGLALIAAAVAIFIYTIHFCQHKVPFSNALKEYAQSLKFMGLIISFLIVGYQGMKAFGLSGQEMHDDQARNYIRDTYWSIKKTV